MDNIPVDILGFFEIHVWICYGFSDQGEATTDDSGFCPIKIVCNTLSLCLFEIKKYILSGKQSFYRGLHDSLMFPTYLRKVLKIIMVIRLSYFSLFKIMRDFN